jgi:hypothetical protein
MSQKVMLLYSATLFALSFQSGGFGEGFDRKVPDDSKCFRKKLLTFATVSIFVTILDIYRNNQNMIAIVAVRPNLVLG